MKYVITKRDRAILIALFGILVLGGVYYFVYMGYTDKTAQLKTQNQALQSRVDVLQSIADQQAELVTQTNENNALAEKILSRFPSNIYEEDVILFAKALQEFAPYELIPNVGIGAPASAFTFADINAQTSEIVNGYIPAEVSGAPAPVPADGGAPAPEGDVAAEPAPQPENAPDPAIMPALYLRNVTIAGETDYDGFKNSIRFINDNLDRSNLTVNASYDITTGMLQASMNIGRYYVTGTGKQYVEPQIRDVIQGTDNIFGTISLTDQRPVNNSTNTGEANAESENE